GSAPADLPGRATRLAGHRRQPARRDRRVVRIRGIFAPDPAVGSAVWRAAGRARNDPVDASRGRTCRHHRRHGGERQLDPAGARSRYRSEIVAAARRRRSQRAVDRAAWACRHRRDAATAVRSIATARARRSGKGPAAQARQRRMITESRLRRQIRGLIRGVSLRQVRLVCGLILFTYLISHFLNHALGNISMEALATGVHYHVMFWRFLPVAIVFYSAALIHAGLGVWALYRRRQFHWKAIEPLQLVLGLSIPALIIAHIAGVRIGQAAFGHDKLYPQVFYADWIAAPYKMWLMYAVLLVSWTHGSIGLYFWLRMKAFYKRAAPFLLAGAVLVPTLAVLGLYQGGRGIARDSASPAW